MKTNLQDLPALWIGGLNKQRTERISILFNELKYNSKMIPSVIDGRYNYGYGNRKATENALIESMKYDSPVMIFEDDANITKDYYNELDIPDDADAVWLGTSICGLIDNWYEHRLYDIIFNKKPDIVGEYKDLYKVHNMLSAHAVLFISRDYRIEMINYLKYCVNDITPPDIIFAKTMKDFNIYACKKPMFFQDDNAHNSHPTLTPLDSIF
jgi:hypothetical protein